MNPTCKSPMKTVAGWLGILGSSLVFAGLALAANVRVDDGPEATQQDSPHLVVDSSGGFHAVWVDRRDGAKNVRYAGSDDGGFSWSASVRVNDEPGQIMSGSQNGPFIRTISPDTILVTWPDLRRGHSDADIHVASSIDGGATWGASVRVNDDTGAAYNFMPSMDVLSDGSVALAWLDERGPGTEMRFSRSTDAGATWSANVVAVTQPEGEPCDCCQPHLLAFAGGAVGVAFRNNITNVRDMYVSISTNMGVTWFPPERVSEGGWTLGSCPGSGPAIAAMGEGAIVTWMDRSRAHSDIWVDEWTGPAAGFGDDRILAEGTSFAVNHPVIAVVGDTVHVAYTSTERDASDIRLVTSTDRGTTWSAPMNLSDATGLTRESEVEIVIDGFGEALAIWTDNRNGAGDIYFGRGGPTGVEDDGPNLPASGNRPGQVLAARPNPFNPQTLIPVVLERAMNAHLAVHDMAGRRLRSLHDGPLAAGNHSFRWNGKTGFGSAVPSGVYVVVLSTDGEEIARSRVVLLE